MSCQPGSSQSSERPPTSSERTAFCSAPSKERSIAITSPVAFICVPSVRSPNGNLSNGQRGIFTTHVVERRLEGGGRLLRDGVRDLVERLADGDLGGDARDRIAGGLAGERGGAGDARVDFDHVVGERRRRVGGQSTVSSLGRGERELDVAAAFDAERADDLERRRAEHLVLLVAAASGDGATTMLSPVWTPIGSKFSMLQTVMQLPAPSRITSYSTSFQPRSDCSTSTWPIGLASRPPATMRAVLLDGVRDAAAGAAERVGGPDDRGQADELQRLDRLVVVGDDHRLRASARRSRRASARKSSRSSALRIASSGVPSRRTLYFSRTPPRASFDGQVEAGLAAERRQQAVRPLALDDARDDVDVERLDVDDVGDVLVGHDRRRVGVDEDGDDAFFAHGLAGLRAGVVELGGLADDDRAGADDEHLLRLLVSHVARLHREGPRRTQRMAALAWPLDRNAVVVCGVSVEHRHRRFASAR